mmetsp:Transcript_105095/g.250172  ORF Transcript_105095/g.250172 Transcript_105095/m.250172 type:complete len:245 (+) Transcript_105095:823-1557(+)
MEQLLLLQHAVQVVIGSNEGIPEPEVLLFTVANSLRHVHIAHMLHLPHAVCHELGELQVFLQIQFPRAILIEFLHQLWDHLLRLLAGSLDAAVIQAFNTLLYTQPVGIISVCCCENIRNEIILDLPNLRHNPQHLPEVEMGTLNRNGVVQVKTFLDELRSNLLRRDAPQLLPEPGAAVLHQAAVQRQMQQGRKGQQVVLCAAEKHILQVYQGKTPKALCVLIQIHCLRNLLAPLDEVALGAFLE